LFVQLIVFNSSDVSSTPFMVAWMCCMAPNAGRCGEEEPTGQQQDTGVQDYYCADDLSWKCYRFRAAEYEPAVIQPLAVCEAVHLRGHRCTGHHACSSAALKFLNSVQSRWLAHAQRSSGTTDKPELSMAYCRLLPTATPE
jgi:hypothetical protein